MIKKRRTASKGIQRTMMATFILPEDVIFQILIWLPVQSLLRCKCVCRSWRALIRSSHFTEHHATTIAVDDNNSKLRGTFICQNQPQELIPRFYLLSHKGFKGLEDLGKHLYFQNATVPGAIRMVDSVHGIICMYNEITRDIVLWNPATRQCRLLPKSMDVNPKDGYDHRDFVGLGFDVQTKDYKVIQVSSLEPQKYELLAGTRVNIRVRPGFNIPRKVQIYCRSTDSWRLIDSDFRTHCYSYGAVGRSLNGIYFHRGTAYTAKPNEYRTQDQKSVILSFDLSKEKYQRVLQIPENNFYQLESIGEKLACITDTRGGGGIYKVWMLNDYNDNTVEEELWTELYRVGPLAPWMLAISWDGKFGLVQGEPCIDLYNPITNEFEDLGFGEGISISYRSQVTIYRESLVSP